MSIAKLKHFTGSCDEIMRIINDAATYNILTLLCYHLESVIQQVHIHQFIHFEKATAESTTI